MRNYNLLWGLWAVWALLVVIWLIDICLDVPVQNNGPMLASILGTVGLALGVFFYHFKRNSPVFSFDKSKKAAPSVQENSEISNLPEVVNSISPVRVKKDTFISLGAQLTGRLTVDGNITVEGQVDGDIQCDDTIKVEHSGQVKGEMKSQQITINGHVEGRIVASAVAILAQGKVIGDIFSDELSIEKGGLFTGQSNPLNPQAPDQKKLVHVEKKKDKIVPATVEQEKSTPSLTES
ncbi:polymer-forming cytoskeletal protein [Pectobacterium sp. B1J-3]|uniref:bactofilin family protein n=1 Tax=Pectobacterium sp. B1J-3 TaxID=3385371 RepID=UPI003906458A